MRLHGIAIAVIAAGCTSQNRVNLVPMQQTAPAPATGSSVPGAAAASTYPGAGPLAPAPTATPYPGAVGATPSLWNQMFGTSPAAPTAPPLVAANPGYTSADQVVQEISTQVQQAVATGRIRPDEAAAIAQEAANKLRENNNSIGAGSRLARGDSGFRPASYEASNPEGYVDQAVFRGVDSTAGAPESRFRVSPDATELEGRLEFDNAANLWRLELEGSRGGEATIDDTSAMTGFGSGERVVVSGRLAAGASWSEAAPRFVVERIERLP